MANRPPGSVKLFVGQLPSTVDEAGLRQIFSEFGNVLETVILRDRATNTHRGCGFVIFSTREEAERAISSQNTRAVLPGATSPMQVKLADGELERLGGMPAQLTGNDWKLFVGMIPRAATEDDVRQLFGKFGVINEVALLRDPSGQSKGCGFVRYADRDQAAAAINALNGFQMDGSPGPLTVKFADNAKQKLAKKLGQVPGAGVGMIPGMANGYGMSQPGYGMDASNPMMSAMGMPNQQTLMLQQQAAMLQQQAVALQAQQQRMMGMQPAMMAGFNMPGASGAATGGAMTGGQQGIGQSIEGPPNCNLFIYNLPHEFTHQDLASIFAPFGNLVSAKIVTDKATGESRGFGFVSYDNPESAQAAIASMNSFVIGTKRLKVQLKQPAGASVGAGAGAAPKPF